MAKRIGRVLVVLLLPPALASAGETMAEPLGGMVSAGAGAGAAAAGKWRHHLFEATPRALMREMSTDRPDATESPYTVDAGHFQIEMSLFDYSRDSGDGIREESRTYGSWNIKTGLFNNTDLHVVFDSYVDESVRAGAQRTSAAGFSHVQARLKINLWGNDGGGTALAVMPFVKFPVGTALSNDRWEGGIILPFAFDVAGGIGAGLMAEADFVYDEDSGGYESEWVHTAVIGFDVAGGLGAFAEYMGVAGTAPGFRYQASLNAGITFRVTDDVQLDAGVRVGLNDAAEDFGAFTGISVRF